LADFRAIRVVGEAVINLLRSSYRPDDFNNELEFRVYTSRDFNSPITNGVSLFLYRVFPCGVNRTPPGRIGPDGRRTQTQLPLELHFLMTVWGREASLQHTIAGWMMRTIEDTPVLPPGVLNSVAPGVFAANETVQLTFAELRTEDLLRIWETVVPNQYQLSIPYLARAVTIDSIQRELKDDGGLVQERAQRVGVLTAPEALP
jgi:hypothetical protein